MEKSILGLIFPSWHSAFACITSIEILNPKIVDRIFKYGKSNFAAFFVMNMKTNSNDTNNINFAIISLGLFNLSNSK